MNFTSNPMISLNQIVSLLRTHARQWLLPAVVCALLASVYALVRPETWEASQALIVRNEATSSRDVPGKFQGAEEMKSVQETILELVRSRGVLAAVLAEVGPAPGEPLSAAWPTAHNIAAFREQVSLAPPKGAEFGTTEVFYLTVNDSDRARAVALADALCTQLEARFQDLRDAKAQSMIDELAKAASLAKNDLDDSVRRLTGTESRVGSDLAELRILQDSSSGESALRRTITEIRGELRQAEAAVQTDQELLRVLTEARADAASLVAVPGQLIESQPAMKRLKEGLIDAKLRTADLMGKMSASHPLVRAAKESELEIHRHLHEELPTAIRAVEVELRLNSDRGATLQSQLAALDDRLTQLAELRAGYATQVAEAQNRTELVRRAEEKLAEARTSQASAKAASLISRIDSPDGGAKPVGPGRLMIVLAGVAGGLMAGLGLLLLSAQPASPTSAYPQPVRPLLPQATNGCRKNGRGETRNGLSLKDALQKLTTRGRLWNR